MLNGRRRSVLGIAVFTVTVANAAVAMSSTKSPNASLDWACDHQGQGRCVCTDEYPLHECQLSGDPGSCRDHYPLLCEGLGDE